MYKMINISKFLLAKWCILNKIANKNGWLEKMCTNMHVCVCKLSGMGEINMKIGQLKNKHLKRQRR